MPVSTPISRSASAPLLTIAMKPPAVLALAAGWGMCGWMICRSPDDDLMRQGGRGKEKGGNKTSRFI
jgi:hypothetical protein